MNRGGHLSRHKGLDRGDSTLARTEWRTPKDRQPGKAKRRKPADGMSEATARRLVYKRSGGACEVRIAGVCLGRATNWHHRQNRSQSGQWLPSVGLHVCGSGTTGCHGALTNTNGHRTEYERNGWIVRSHQNPAAVPVLYAGRDFYLLDDAGDLHLAPWPLHPDIHPDDLEVPKPVDAAGEAA